MADTSSPGGFQLAYQHYVHKYQKMKRSHDEMSKLSHSTETKTELGPTKAKRRTLEPTVEVAQHSLLDEDEEEATNSTSAYDPVKATLLLDETDKDIPSPSYSPNLSYDSEDNE